MVNEPTHQPDLSVKPLAAHGNERLAAFSDGVFAITITLLVLEIKVPDIAPDLVATELPIALWHQVPKMIGHVLSFFVMGLYWIAHHNMFMHVKRHDHVLLWLNTLFLLCIASVPFPTGLLGHYPDAQIAVVSYGSILFLTGVFLNLIWWYATTHQLIDQGLDSKFIQFVHRYIRVAPLLYLLSIGIAFINLTLAKLIFLIVAIFYIIPNPFHRRHYKQFIKRFDQ